VDAFLSSRSPVELGSVGGNSSCVELRFGSNIFIFDSGSGIRELGHFLMNQEFGRGEGTANIFLSHTHWDHIMGFPFFIPAYVPGNKLYFRGCHDNLHERVHDQQVAAHFPVALEAMSANKEFIQMEPGKPVEIAGALVTPFQMFHPGNSYGYRVEFEEKVFVYASDTELTETKHDHTRFLRNADLLILDTMYTFDEALNKRDWGHCSPMVGVDISIAEHVKKLALFHHEPTHSDNDLDEILMKTIAYKMNMAHDVPLEILLAYEGLEVEI
jgi:phosphoribosyl 1,2-cyclic phosphodiesterase